MTLRTRSARVQRFAKHRPLATFAASAQEKSSQKKSGTLIVALSKAIRKQGIPREAIFLPSSSKKVFAYSVLPSDTSKIIRESADGTRTIGHFDNGVFRAIKPEPRI